jgi:hypothetical protein
MVVSIACPTPERGGRGKRCFRVARGVLRRVDAARHLRAGDGRDSWTLSWTS